MNTDAFKTIADTLRQYRRSDLSDFAVNSNDDPIDILYTDPLNDDAVLKTVLSSNTTFITGRKGTGKSTIFAKAQREIRRKGHSISAYVDVKSLYETVSQANSPILSQNIPENIDRKAVEVHLLRKTFLGRILKELVKETRQLAGSLNFFERWTGVKSRYENLITNLLETESEVSDAELKIHELPILEVISANQKIRRGNTSKEGDLAKGSLSVQLSNVDASVSGEVSRIDEALSDEEVFEQYSKALLRSFPFNEIIETIIELLINAGMDRLFVFFDDFSELNWVDQRLFVDVILAPLNNTSNERIKLKVAGYPGRVYYGKIDPGKIDEINIDFYSLYRSPRLPEIEGAAIDYTKRLLEKRFRYYSVEFRDYLADREDPDEYYSLIFQTTFNIPRMVGYILHYCYLDRVARGKPITKQVIQNAALRYYEEKLTVYFRLNRFALEPYDRKLDRHNQKLLIDTIVSLARNVRMQIITGQLSNALLKGITNPPTSHFTISTDMESLLGSLELNLFVSKYHQMRDKDGREISVFALHYGLCMSERIEWGYPQRQRYDKDYFKQRCFNYNTSLHQFLASTKTIRCDRCGASHPMEELDKIKYYKWRCPECIQGECKVVSLDRDFKGEIAHLQQEIMVEPIEFEILHVLHDEEMPLRAKEISALLDVTYQLVGKRTDKLQDMGYVKKQTIDGQKKSVITKQASNVYFSG